MTAAIPARRRTPVPGERQREHHPERARCRGAQRPAAPVHQPHLHGHPGAHHDCHFVRRLGGAGERGERHHGHLLRQRDGCGGQCERLLGWGSLLALRHDAGSPYTARSKDA